MEGVGAWQPLGVRAQGLLIPDTLVHEAPSCVARERATVLPLLVALAECPQATPAPVAADRERQLLIICSQSTALQ